MAGKVEALFGTEHPVALVTGSGAPRLGNAIVRALAERGYRVAVHAHRHGAAAEQTAAELRSQGHEVFAVTADLSEEQRIAEMIHAVKQRFGRLDVLVNSAAIWQRQRLEDVTADSVRQHLQVNTVATFLCCQQVGLLMTSQPTGGAIVNLGDWAIVRPYLDYAAYFPSKGAIPTLTRDLAVELASRNPRVRVNAVLPGAAMIPDDLPEKEQQAAIRGTLVQRAGSPSYIAEAVIFLIEHEFITGVCLPVDGGRRLVSPP